MNAHARTRTTTWPQRHQATLATLAEELRRQGQTEPRVLEVGPGAVSRLLRRALVPGEGRDLSPVANWRRAGLRNLDGLIRRLPGVPLHSYEPGELLAVLPQGARLIVSDINPRVLRAVAAEYPQVETRAIDFSREVLTPPADVVVGLCVLVRAADPKAIFAHLYASLRPGGLLVMDHRSIERFRGPEHALDPLAPQIWRRPVAAGPAEANPIPHVENTR